MARAKKRVYGSTIFAEKSRKMKLYLEVIFILKQIFAKNSLDGVYERNASGNEMNVSFSIGNQLMTQDIPEQSYYND